MISSSENFMSNIPTQENGPNIGTSSNTTRRREVKSRSSDIFKIYFHLVETENESRSICNYCGVSYKFTSGYDNMNKHLERHHAAEVRIDPTQTQISRFASSSGGMSSSKLFKYSDKKIEKNMLNLLAWHIFL